MKYAVHLQVDDLNDGIAQAVVRFGLSLKERLGSGSGSFLHRLSLNPNPNPAVLL